jgi:hypothetical protein
MTEAGVEYKIVPAPGLIWRVAGRTLNELAREGWRVVAAVKPDSASAR